jgi:hypothetical protein
MRLVVVAGLLPLLLPLRAQAQSSPQPTATQHSRQVQLSQPQLAQPQSQPQLAQSQRAQRQIGQDPMMARATTAQPVQPLLRLGLPNLPRAMRLADAAPMPMPMAQRSNAAPSSSAPHSSTAPTSSAANASPGGSAANASSGGPAASASPGGSAASASPADAAASAASAPGDAATPSANMPPADPQALPPLIKPDDSQAPARLDVAQLDRAYSRARTTRTVGLSLALPGVALSILGGVVLIFTSRAEQIFTQSSQIIGGTIGLASGLALAVPGIYFWTTGQDDMDTVVWRRGQLTSSPR